MEFLRNVYPPRPSYRPAPSATITRPTNEVCLRLQNFNEYISLMLQASRYLDLKFLCADGFLWAHKIVIANASPYLASTFNDQLPGEITIVSVEDISVAVLLPMLDIAYRGSCVVAEDLIPKLREGMMTLGWVRMEVLNKTYVDPINPYSNGSDNGAPVVPIGVYPPSHTTVALSPFSKNQGPMNTQLPPPDKDDEWNDPLFEKINKEIKAKSRSRVDENAKSNVNKFCNSDRFVINPHAQANRSKFNHQRRSSDSVELECDRKTRMGDAELNIDCVKGANRAQGYQSSNGEGSYSSTSVQGQNSSGVELKEKQSKIVEVIDLDSDDDDSKEIIPQSNNNNNSTRNPEIQKPSAENVPEQTDDLRDIKINPENIPVENKTDDKYSDGSQNYKKSNKRFLDGDSDISSACSSANSNVTENAKRPRWDENIHAQSNLSDEDDSIRIISVGSQANTNTDEAGSSNSSATMNSSYFQAENGIFVPKIVPYD